MAWIRDVERDQNGHRTLQADRRSDLRAGRGATVRSGLRPAPSMKSRHHALFEFAALRNTR
jgi:hypothetical protein